MYVSVIWKDFLLRLISSHMGNELGQMRQSEVGSLLPSRAFYHWSHPESFVDEPAFPLKGDVSGNPLKHSC